MLLQDTTQNVKKMKNHDIMRHHMYRCILFTDFYSIIVIITLNADLLTLSPKTLLSCRNPNNILGCLYNISLILAILGNNTYE